MWIKLGVLLTAVIGWLSTIFYARKEAKKAEQLANLRRELDRKAKERQRVQTIVDSVRNMPDNDVRQRLQNTKRN